MNKVTAGFGWARWSLNIGILFLMVYPVTTFLSPPVLTSEASSRLLPSFLDAGALTVPAAYSQIERYDMPELRYLWLYCSGVVLVVCSWLGARIFRRRP